MTVFITMFMAVYIFATSVSAIIVDTASSDSFYKLERTLQSAYVCLKIQAIL